MTKPANTCRYCPHQRRADSPLCNYHEALESACNIVEDECGGATPPAMVDSLMVEWGFGYRHHRELNRQLAEAGRLLAEAVR